MIYQAREAYNKVIPAARGDAERTIKDAEGYALERINRAKGDANRFVALLKEYSKARDVTRRRLYLEAMGRAWSSNYFASYLETSGDARVFVPVPIRKHVLALRAWGRQVDGPVNLDNTLFFGGPETVRGYPFGQREGEEGYLLSAEYRMPLFLMPISPRGEIIGAGLHLFTDAGDAWYHGAEAGRSMFSYGAGVHLNIDTLQLRFEMARTREGEWMFEFFDVFNF